MSNAVPSPSADPALDAGARSALDAWRASYVGRLAAPNGWWAICALHWLDDGTTRMGSGASADLPLSAPCPADVATLHRDGDRVTVTPAADRTLFLDGEAVTEPTVVHDADRVFTIGPDLDAPRFAVLVRGHRRGVRVYDPARAAAKDPERDVAWYPLEPGWVVPADFTPAEEGETVPIVTLQGDVVNRPAAGRLRFRMQGTEHTLLATGAADALFVNLRDAGSGPATYGAGRFLRVDAPANGRTWLDFHRLHHPPCAHTPFATCPLPPLENRLPFEVKAGERTA